MIYLAVGEIVFYVRCNDVTQIQTESGTKVLQMQAKCKYKFVHTELVILMCTHWISTSIYDIKLISS
jgi:hypothetical protein